MNKPLRWMSVVVTVLTLLPALTPAATIDAMVAAMANGPEKERLEARKLLPRQSVEVLPKLLPLVTQDDQAVWRPAFNVLADFANQVSVPGREVDRATVTANLMTLVAPEQPEPVKLRGLRLLSIVVPTGCDVAPIAKLLDDEKLREKARAALVEMGTPEACTAMREKLLKTADVDFQCALLDGLGQLKDKASVATVEPLTQADNARVRAAAMRALSWTGKPAYLKTAKAVLASSDVATRPDALDALLRLTNAVVEDGGNRQIAVDTYLELLKSDDSLQKDAALGALGRIGDGSCVAPILAAIKDTDNPNRANGIAALRAMQGVDVAREIVATYPRLSQGLQLALLPVLGSKKHAVVMPVLVQAAKSTDPAFRAAALAALGEAGQPAGLEPLLAAAKSGNAAEKAVVGKSLLSMADTMKAAENRKDAGKAYLAALQTAAEPASRAQALEGLAHCPTADALDTVKTAAADKELREPSIKALVALGKTLAAAKQKKKAVEAYKAARDLKPSGAAMTAIIQGLHGLGEKVDLPGVLGVVSTWSLVGPFELGEQNEGWKKHYISEPKVDLTARYMAGKRRLDWKRVITTDASGKVDLLAELGPNEKCIGYAYAEITLKEAADAVLLLGVDDSEKVYVNGQKVHDQLVARGMTPDQDKIPVKLKAGKNTILLKIWQNAMGWEFCARLTTPGGDPLVFTQGD